MTDRDKILRAIHFEDAGALPAHHVVHNLWQTLWRVWREFRSRVRHA